MTRLIAAALLAGLALMFWSVPRAHSADYQLMRALPGEDFKPRGKVLSSATACALDLASDANVQPAGTKLRCEKVKPAVNYN